MLHLPVILYNTYWWSSILQVIVLDDNTPFDLVFIVICHALNLSYYILAKSDHKDFMGENVHRFLNKTVIIATEARGTCDIFVPATVVASYT